MREVKFCLGCYKWVVNAQVFISQQSTQQQVPRQHKLKMFKIIITIFLVLSISMLTQSAPAAEPAPAPCRVSPEQICETRSSLDENGQPIQEVRCRVVERLSSSCFEGK